MKTIEISPKSILVFFGMILGAYVLFLLRDIIFSLFISLIFVSALHPAVNYLDKKGVPRGIAAASVFFAFIGTFIALLIYVLPPLISEINNFAKNIPQILSQLNPTLRSYIDVNQISNAFPSVTGQALTVISGFLSNIVFLVTTLFFTFYSLLEEKHIAKTLREWIPASYRVSFFRTLKEVRARLSSWFWGEVTLMTVIGLLSYIVLTILGVKYALPLSIMAGLLEAVPTVGPILSAVPAILVTAGTPNLMIAVIIGYILIQQLENNLIVPVVMRRAVGLSPIAILIALIAGSKLGGGLGVLLAIPVSLVIVTSVQEWRSQYTE